MALAFAILLLSASHGWVMRTQINRRKTPVDCDAPTSYEQCTDLSRVKCPSKCAELAKTVSNQDAETIGQLPDGPDDSEIPFASEAEQSDNQLATESLEDQDAVAPTAVEVDNQLAIESLEDQDKESKKDTHKDKPKFMPWGNFAMKEAPGGGALKVMKVWLKKGQSKKDESEKKDKSDKNDKADKKRNVGKVNGPDGEKKEKKEVDGDRNENENKSEKNEKKYGEVEKKKKKSDQKDRKGKKHIKDAKDNQDAKPIGQFSNGFDDSEVPVAPTAEDDFDFGTSGIIVQLTGSFGFIKPDTSNDNKHNLYFHASGVAGGTSFSFFRMGDRMKYEVGVDERHNTAFAKLVDFNYGTSGTIVQLKKFGLVRYGSIKPDTSSDDNHLHNLHFNASGVAGSTSFKSFQTGDRVKYEVGADERHLGIANQVDFNYGTSGTIIHLKSSGPVRYGFIKPDTSNGDNHNLRFHEPGVAAGTSFNRFQTGERVKYEVGFNERWNQTIAKQVKFETTPESRSRESGAHCRGRDDIQVAKRWSRTSPFCEETSAFAEDADLDKAAAQQGEANATPKHQLQHSWCLWVHQRPDSQKGGVWTQSQRILHKFATAEDFWRMPHLSKPPSKLENAAYSLFKQGITPAWEDPAFENGGRWVVYVEKVRAQNLDDLWLSLSSALLGEAFIENGGELVCGAIVSVRSYGSKVSLWLSVAKDEKKVLAIGREYRNVLATTPGFHDFASKEMTFEDFEEHAVTFNLPRPLNADATAGVFQ